MTGERQMFGIEPPLSAHLSVRPDEPAMRLRDLIFGLQQDGSRACQLIDRLDPAIADELHAIIAHRRISLADFVADALLQVALEAADSAWRLAIAQRPGSGGQAEVAQLGHVLRKAMRRHLQASDSIGSDRASDATMVRQQRVGHPYIPE